MSLLQEDLIEKVLPNIIKSLSKFTFSNKTQPNIEDLARGELFTLIRRHLPHLCTTTYNLTKYNVERIYIDYNTGKILWICFLKEHRFRGCYKEEVIDCLNNTLEKINPDYGNLNLEQQLSSITKNIEDFKIVKV